MLPHHPLSLCHSFSALQCSTANHSHHVLVSCFHFQRILEHEDTSGCFCGGWKAMALSTNNPFSCTDTSWTCWNVFDWLAINKLYHKCDQAYGQRSFGLNLKVTSSEAHCRKTRLSKIFIYIWHSLILKSLYLSSVQNPVTNRDFLATTLRWITLFNYSPFGICLWWILITTMLVNQLPSRFVKVAPENHHSKMPLHPLN